MTYRNPASATKSTPAPAEAHGCHCDLEPGQEPDGCVIDEGRPQDCVHARRPGATRDACEYWRPIAFKPQPKGKEADTVQVPRQFLTRFYDLAHNYSLRAVAPDYYQGTERDAFEFAYARCGSDLIELRKLLPVQSPAPAHGGPHLRKLAARLLAQLADNRPRRALDLDATRQLLEVIAASADADKLIADLTRKAWEWGASCEIDDVRWGEAGDSHNQMWRDKAAEAGSRLQAALLAAAAPAPAVAQATQEAVLRACDEALAAVPDQQPMRGEWDNGFREGIKCAITVVRAALIPRHSKLAVVGGKEQL